jgi:hypothetical protein
VGQLRPDLVVKQGPLPGEVDPDWFILLGLPRQNPPPGFGPEIEASGVDGQGYFVVELFGGLHSCTIRLKGYTGISTPAIKSIVKKVVGDA